MPKIYRDCFIPCLKVFLLSLLPLTSLVVNPSPTKAGCVVSDINAQYVIGPRSTNSPPTQTNDLDIRYGKHCLGNSSHGNNLQLRSGTGTVQQTRNRSVYLDSGQENLLQTLDTPNVDARVDQQMYLPILPSQ